MPGEAPSPMIRENDLDASGRKILPTATDLAPDDFDLNDPDIVDAETDDILEPSDDRTADPVPSDETSPGPSAESTLEVHPQKTARSFLSTFRSAIVSAVDRHTSQVTTLDGRTKTVFSKEVVTAAAEKFAAHQLAESKEKREGSTGKKVLNFFDRIWKGTFTEGLHRVKEKKHGIKLLEAAGVETGISPEFNAELDKRAREKIAIEQGKRNWFQKAGYNVEQAFRELVGMERDLHNKKVTIAAELRAQYLADPLKPDNPLQHLIIRDQETREYMAQKIMDAPTDFLHEGDMKTDAAIKVDASTPEGAAVDGFFKGILLKIKEDTIDQLDKNKYNGKISAGLRAQLDEEIQDYIYSDQFESWKKTLPPEQAAKMQNAITHASNYLKNAEDVFMPVIKDNVDAFRSMRGIDTDIEFILGTGTLGAAGDIETPSIFYKDKERISLNQETYNLFREKVKTSKHRALFSDKDVNAGLRREMALAMASATLGNEAAAAFASTVGLRAVTTLARSSMAWLPVIGTGLVSGTVAGAKEYRRMGTARQQWFVEEAMGEEHPLTDNAVISEAMRKRDMVRADFGMRAQQFTVMYEKLKQEGATEQNVLQTLAYLVDSRARMKLEDRHRIPMFGVQKNSPSGRENYEVLSATHDKARLLAHTTLAGMFDGPANAALRSQIATAVGLDPAIVTDTRSIVNILSESHADHLRTGTRVHSAAMAVMGRDPSLLVELDKSMVERQEAFNAWRWGRVATVGVTAGVIGGLIAGATGLAEGKHIEFKIPSWTEHVTTSSHTWVDADMPTHVTGLPNGASAIENPFTHTVVGSNLTHIPYGTHWEPDAVDHNAFDLVSDQDPTHVFINNATFTSDGHMVETPSVLHDLSVNHFKVDYQDHGTFTFETKHEGIDTSTWTNKLTYEQMEGSPNQFFANNYHEIVQAHPELGKDVDPSTIVNGEKMLWRGIEGHILKQGNVHVNQIEGFHRIVHTDDISPMTKDVTHVPEFLTEAQANNVEVTGLPDFIATKDGQVEVVKLIHEAVTQHNLGQPFSDKAHEYAYQLSYVGTEDVLKHPEYFTTIVDYLEGQNGGGDAIGMVAHEMIIKPTQDIVESVSNVVPGDAFNVDIPLTPLAYLSTAPGYFHPLEQSYGSTKDLEIVNDYNLRYYGGEADKDRLKRFKEMRSQNLELNPGAALDDRQEVESYINKFKPEYRAKIEKLASEAGALSPDTKLSVLIPVADHQEEKNIFASLENYSKQTADPKDYEIVLFLNHPEHDREGRPIQADGTEAEIRRFMAKYPHINVKIMKMVEPFSEAKIGYLRKYLADAAELRQLQRYQNAPEGAHYEPLIMVSNDADNKGISPDYIKNFIQRFQENPDADAFLGQLDWDPEAYAKYPLVHIGTRLFQYLGARGRRNSGRMPSSGANFAYKSNIYAAIGGYIAELSGGEDIAIGQAIAAGRKTNTTVKYAGAGKSRIFTSARRAVDALNNYGLAPVEQWNKGFSAFDDEIRRLQLGGERDINYDDPQELAKLKDGLELIINRTIDTYEAGEKLGKDAFFYRQALEHLGIEYFIKDGNIMITDMSVLVRSLKNYRQTGELMQKIKSRQGSEAEIAEAEAKLAQLDEQYKASVKANEDKLALERKERAVEVDQQLAQFMQTEKLEFSDVPPLRYTLDQLKQSTNTEEHGDYVLCLDKPLGSGQMGQVVAGYHKTTGQVLSFKRIKKEEQENIAKLNKYPDGVKDLEDEVKKVTSNPVLGTYQDKIDLGDTVVKVTPLEATDFNSYLRKVKSLPPKQAVAVAIHLLSGLRDMHKGNIAHLDVSAPNILIGQDHVKIIDFDAGSIKTKADTKYRRGFVGGYKRIIPPELFLASSPIRENADTYEAAVLLYRMISGDYPYTPDEKVTGEARRENIYNKHLSGRFTRPAGVSDEVWAVLERGINPLPKDRYQTADEMLKDLLAAYKKLS